jgi:uncharacterized protein (DUF2236 family)
MRHPLPTLNQSCPPPRNVQHPPTESHTKPIGTCPWHTSLTLPGSDDIKESFQKSEVSQEDLNAVRSMVERLHIRWRYFLVQPGFMQIMVPEIAEKVRQASRYLNDTSSRFEATRVFLKTVILEGPDSERGEEILARINSVHSHIGIDPDSRAFTFVLFTLSHQFVHSIRINTNIAPTEKEEEALFKILRRVGVKMGAHTIPERYSEFVAANKDFLCQIECGERETSQSVAKQLLKKGVTPLPLWYRPVAKSLALSFVEPKILDHLGIKPPPSAVRSFVKSACKMMTTPSKRL